MWDEVCVCVCVCRACARAGECVCVRVEGGLKRTLGHVARAETEGAAVSGAHGNGLFLSFSFVLSLYFFCISSPF